MRLLRRERFVGHLLRYAVLAVIAGASVWGTARASAEPPPPVQPSITETIHGWWDWWWGIRPLVKSRRVYIGGDGAVVWWVIPGCVVRTGTRRRR